MNDIFDLRQFLTENKNPTSTKMTKSALKAKVREGVLAEIAEAKKKKAEPEIVDDEVIDDTTDVTSDSTAQASGEVLDLQVTLKKAYDAASKLGDQKLVDQIGNTITFFTRTHVLDKSQVDEQKFEYIDDKNPKRVILKVGNLYQVYDAGLDAWNDDYEYLGFDTNSREHMFKALDAPGSNDFHFVGIPDQDIETEVKI